MKSPSTANLSAARLFDKTGMNSEKPAIETRGGRRGPDTLFMNLAADLHERALALYAEQGDVTRARSLFERLRAALVSAAS